MARKIVVTKDAAKKFKAEMQKVLAAPKESGLECIKDDIMDGVNKGLSMKAIADVLKAAGITVSTRTLSETIKEWKDGGNKPSK